MVIEKIFLSNFRNIIKLDWSPNSQLNILIGNNGQGKTNIIESIYLTAYLRSFRSSKNENFILHGEKSSSISMKLNCLSFDKNIIISINKEGKEVRINNKKPDSYQDFFSGLLPILFSPEEIQLIRGTPSGRRALIDKAVFQGNNKFIKAIIDFNRYLRHRNKLLKDERPEGELIPWTQGLIKTGALVRAERIRYIDRLAPIFKEVYCNLTDNRETAELGYPITATDEKSLEKNLSEDFIRSSEREKILKQTLPGPHRDDPLFTIGGKSLRQYASQGQQRSFILAFKIAQIMELEKRTGETPVLLLDDLTSELDQQRQKFFFDFILKRRGQVFITTTDIDPLLRRGLNDGSFYLIDGGKIRSVAN